MTDGDRDGAASYFARLGRDVEERFLAHDREEEAFPKIAEEALAAHPPQGGFDREAFLESELDPMRVAVQQRAPLGAYGQPGITTYFGRDFVVEVYFWQNCIAGIHNHPFRGLFTILEGESVHAVYSFEESADSPRGRLRVGRLQLETLELLEQYEHRLFSGAAHPLIHALLHVPRPAISMVIRTIRAEGYRRYHGPTLSLPWDEPDAVLSRQLVLLNALHAVGDPKFEERFERYLESADLETSYRALANAWAGIDGDLRRQLIATVRARHPEHTDALRAALSRTTRRQNAETIRSQLLDADDRLVATALLLAETRSQVLDVIGRRHDDPVARLHAFMDKLGDFVAGDPATAGAARVLIDGGGREGVLAYLRNEHGDAVVTEQAEMIEGFATESLFAGLAG